MAKRHLEQYDKNGNRIDIYLNEEEVMVGDQTLAEKLADMEDDIGDAAQTGGEGTVTGVKVGSNTYEPTDGVVDISGAVPTSTNDLSNDSGFTTKTYVDAAVLAVQTALNNLMNGQNVTDAIDTFNEVKAFLDGISSSDTLAAKLATLVPNTRTINGKSLSSNVTIGINDIDGLAAAIAAAGSGAVSVSIPDPADGTFTIHVGDDSYTVNLNHTHENMAKLVVCEESELPSTLDPATIYAITDSEETEIEKLIIRGMEFAGGGAAPGTPAIYTTPGGSTLNLGQNDGTGASGTITVKGRNLTGDLTVAVTANSGLSLSYGSQTGVSVTIDQADAETAVGVDVDVLYSGSGALDLADGLSISGGGASTKSMKVVVAEPAPIELDGVKLTGTQWIETDYYPNPKTEFVFELTFETNSNTEVVNNNISKVFFGCKANSSPTSYFVFYHINTASANDHRAYITQILNEGDVSNQNLFAANAVGGTYPSAASMQKMTTPHSILRYTVGSSTYHLSFEPGGVPDSNNSDYTSTNLQKKTSTMTYPLGIGARPGHTDSPYARFNLTVHRLTITEGGVAVRDYVPRIKGGKVGLLDIATNGTGLFLTSETAKTSGLDADELVAVPLSSNS